MENRVSCLSRFKYERNPERFGEPLYQLLALRWWYRKHFFYQGYGRHTKDERNFNYNHFIKLD